MTLYIYIYRRSKKYERSDWLRTAGYSSYSYLHGAKYETLNRLSFLKRGAKFECFYFEFECLQIKQLTVFLCDVHF